jgi:hypothetical protein
MNLYPYVKTRKVKLFWRKYGEAVISLVVGMVFGFMLVRAIFAY